VTNRRAALILPGRGYGPSAPLLEYASWAAHRRGADISAVNWERASEIIRLPDDDGSRAVCAQVEPHLDRMAALRPLVIGKSLGSHASPLAAERDLPAVWLTPLLHRSWVVDGLRASRAPFLLIGGTADGATWRGDLARSLSPHVLEIAGADHGMFVPGPLAASAAVLGQVATAIEQFLDEIVWPVA
jgi:hypothetical protein